MDRRPPPDERHDSRAERLRRSLDNIPWETAGRLYGSPLAMELRVAGMRAELAGKVYVVLRPSRSL